MNPDCTLNNELSLHEAAELLAEVRLETQASQTELFDFAGLLSELINLQLVGAEQGSAAERDELNEFLSKGLSQVRAAMDADPLDLEHLNQLSVQAIGRWGDALAASQDRHASQTDEAWADAATTGDLPMPEDEEEGFEQPTAAAIEALLSQLGADPPQQPSQPTLPATSPSNPPAAEPLLAAISDSDSVEGIESLDPELREAFLDDAASCLGSMETALLRLESNPQDQESLNQILRELHTLKGASGSVGLSALADLIHQLEDGLRDDHAAGRAPSVDNLFQSVHHIRSQFGASTPMPPAAMPPASTPATSLPPSVPSPTVTPPTATPPAATATKVPSTGEVTRPATAQPVFSDDSPDDELVRVKSSQLNRLMDMLVELVMLRNQRETELSELQSVYHELVTSVAKMRLLSNESEMRADSSTSLQLSEVASDVLETAQQVRDCARPFASGNAAVSRFIRQFRQELVELRRTPISGLFRRLQLVARDAARAESKQVRLAFKGEDSGIERTLQQRLYEPLLHIVRNCVCHGIEPAAERTQIGKPAEGVISLEAISGPNLFVIEVRDDGRGLDYEAIRRRGVERGLLSADQAVNRDELSQLIFHPGFSTRDTANQAGGRGVGMDVVASTMQRMRGWLEVASEPGQGTRIRLSFPLPSVIQHAMVFRCADQLFALPMESIQAAGKVSHDIPRAEFSTLLGLDATQGHTNQQPLVVADDSRVLTNGQAALLALLVDDIIGPEELVVRPLPSLLKHHPFCVGATLSGMGQTVLLLDARRLLRSRATSLTRVVPRAQPDQLGQPSQPPTTAVRLTRVLVVDDSLSARKRVVRSLSRYPLDIVEASDGKEALELLKKESFAAVFSDMEMPNVDGMELLAELQSFDQGAPPPVVIISSRSEQEFTDRARRLGAANYLIKPLADEALDAAMQTLTPLRHFVSDITPTSPEK